MNVDIRCRKCGQALKTDTSLSASSVIIECSSCENCFLNTSPVLDVKDVVRGVVVDAYRWAYEEGPLVGTVEELTDKYLVAKKEKNGSLVDTSLCPYCGRKKNSGPCQASHP